MQKNKNISRGLVLFTAVIVILFTTLFILTRIVDKVDVSSESAPDITGQPIMGNEDAKVTIVEFGDYKCPSCKAWGEQVLPRLIESYIVTGEAKFSYVNVLFHGNESLLGALASEAVFAESPNAFWAFHKALFDAQPDGNHDDLWITSDKVVEVAGKADPGIDTNKLREAIDDQLNQEQVSQDQELVKQFNVQQTPTIMINNVLITNPFDYDLIARTIEAQLEN